MRFWRRRQHSLYYRAAALFLYRYIDRSARSCPLENPIHAATEIFYSSPIDGELIVVDRDAGIAKTVTHQGERDLWLHGSLEQSHAQFLKAFYPNVEVRSER
jgi:hypothetical protein